MHQTRQRSWEMRRTRAPSCQWWRGEPAGHHLPQQAKCSPSSKGTAPAQPGRRHRMRSAESTSCLLTVSLGNARQSLFHECLTDALKSSAQDLRISLADGDGMTLRPAKNKCFHSEMPSKITRCTVTQFMGPGEDQ